MVFQESFVVDTQGRGSHSLTSMVQEQVGRSGIQTGMASLFVHHTSASLILCENADPEVRADLERFMARLIPDGDPLFRHISEGADDMPAHVRTILTDTGLTLPISQGRCDLGTWQGIFLWEHRHAQQRRRLTLTLYGE